jgi:hypothetical protein
VKVNHSAGYKTTYYHLAEGSIPSDVYVGVDVTQGQVLGTIGTTGNSTGTHLHFSISYNGSNYSSTSGLSGVEMEGILFVDYVAGSWYESTNDAAPTCTTSTHSINLVTAEASGSSYNLYGYAVYGSGDSATFGGSGQMQANTGSTSSHVAWLTGNVNGDEWDDVVEITDSGSYTYAQVYEGTGGNGLNSRTEWVKTTKGVINAFLQDFDDDGDDDLILAYGNSNGTVKWKYYTSAIRTVDSVTGWSFGGTTNGTIWSSSFGKTTDVFVVGDFNGHNKAELLQAREADGTADTTFSETLTWKRFSSTNVTSTVISSSSGGYGYSGDQFIASDFDSDGDDDLVRIDLNDSEVSVLVAKYESDSFTTPSIRATDVGGMDGQYYFYPLDYIDNYPDLLRVHDDPDVSGESSDALSMSRSDVDSSGTRIWEEQDEQDPMLTGMSTSAVYLFGYFGDYDVCE